MDRTENMLIEKIKNKLWEKAKPPINNQGYYLKIEDNLIEGVTRDLFEEDLQKGAGKELEGKFLAVHSSSALAVNTFAVFKNCPGELKILGMTGFPPPSFEKQFPTGLKGIPPTLDVSLRRGNEIVAIESKFLEYFSAKKAIFRSAYSPKSLNWAKACWWRVLEEAKKAGKRHLDVAQLVKHYFGISRLLNKGDSSGWKPSKATLLYLFWEPDNAEKIAVCLQHREELQELASLVKDSDVDFKFLSYRNLWKEWEANPKIKSHVINLHFRYDIKVET